MYKQERRIQEHIKEFPHLFWKCKW